MGVLLFRQRRYNLISAVIALFACLPFYFAYEKREGSIRRMVILAVMTAMTVTGRCVFAPVPYFKPTISIVILSGLYMGPEAGFLVGSLSAVISNIFFGQGPWTPFQMLTWGIIAMIPGLPIFRKTLRHRIPLFLYGIFAGMAYSWLMDIWTAISWYGSFTWEGYRAALISAIPVVVVYCISNVMFLMILLKPIGEKLERIQIKHGIF